MNHPQTRVMPTVAPEAVRQLVVAGRVTADATVGSIRIEGKWKEFSLPAGIMPLLDFFQTPRTESEARIWLDDHGARPDALETMLADGYITTG